MREPSDKNTAESKGETSQRPDRQGRAAGPSETPFLEGAAPAKGGAREGESSADRAALEEPRSVLVEAQALSELEKKAGERDAYRNELLRAMADLDNFQKRVRKDRVTWEEQAAIKWIRKLLPVMDDFDRALKAIEEGSSMESVAGGVRLTYQALLRALKDGGVEEIPAQGWPFDPQLHEAVAEEISDRPTGEILEVLEKGYRKDSTVIRPSKVKVAKNVASL